MIWVLDTTALFCKPLMRILTAARARYGPKAAPVQVLLPSLAYAERLRQIRRDGKNETHWKRSLELAGIQIEPFRGTEADRLEAMAQQDDVWKTHARDCLIRCHVHGARTLITDDRGPAFEESVTTSSPIAARALEEILE